MMKTHRVFWVVLIAALSAPSFATAQTATAPAQFTFTVPVRVTNLDPIIAVNSNLVVMCVITSQVIGWTNTLNYNPAHFETSAAGGLDAIRIGRGQSGSLKPDPSGNLSGSVI